MLKKSLFSTSWLVHNKIILFGPKFLVVSFSFAKIVKLENAYNADKATMHSEIFSYATIFRYIIA